MEPAAIEREYTQCFGCGPANASGLHLQFVQTGTGEVECRYTTPPEYCGSDGVVHGGIQATLLDETMGFAVRALTGDRRAIVTAEFSLRYRRPVPIGVPLVVRASVVTDASPHFHLEGGIFLADEVAPAPLDPPAVTAPDLPVALTTATARWRLIG